LQVYGEDSTEARAGECVALNLPEIDHLEVRRGMVLCASDALESVTMAEADLTLLDSVKGTVEDFLEVHCHVGTASVLANVAMLEQTEMSAGQRQMVQLRLTQPLPLLPGERYVLRANVPGLSQGGLVTIGGGRILGVSNLRLRRKKQWTLDTLAARRQVLDDPAGWCELMLRESRKPLSARELENKCHRRPEEFTALLAALGHAGRVVPLSNGALAHRSKVEETAHELLAALDAFHAANPQRAGLTREELAPLLREDPGICDLACETLLSSRQVERIGLVFARAGRSARLSGPDQDLAEQVSTAFQKAGWAGPTALELASSLRQPQLRVEKLILLLAERGILVRLDPSTHLHRDALEAAKQVVVRLFAAKRSFSTMEFRDTLAVSRKYAVPLLDYLDKLRFTVRTGHDRTPGVEARKRMSP
jgi:selenocysteine-specific elongation factor